MCRAPNTHEACAEPMNVRTIRTIGLWGGLGGGINALLCYAKLPVDIGERFQWHIIPAGVAHGALLAVLAAGWAAVWMRRPTAVRAAGAALVGWLAGWLSYVCLDLSVTELRGVNTHALWWSFQSDRLAWVWTPFLRFGLVSALAYVGWNLLGLWNRTERAPHLMVGMLSGAFGSLWWWASWNLWYLAFLHGAIWGSLVGYGVWRSQRPVVQVHHL